MSSSLLLAIPAAAQELKIAVAADVTSIDPHFFNLFPNNNIAEHIFDKLVQMDADSRMIPGIATSWKALDEKTWEFKLRKGVKFHDGSELTAEDVAFSINRVPTVPNSPGPFSAYTKAITGIEIVDPYTIRFKTAAPHPLMPNDMSTIYIVSKKIATGATTEDFNSGKVAVGSGRYKFVRYANGDRVELVRNDNYWGEKPAFEKVQFKIIKNEAARMAALLSGDVDAIEQPPTADLARLKNDPKFTLTSKISHRVIYFNFDHLDARRARSSPAKDGKPLDKNPLQDVRVRRAISKAINRPAIAERVMEGQAIPSGQLVSEKLFGHNPALKAEAYDPEGAKKLLAEAGYPNGFNLTIHGPSGRYVNDEKIVQAVAQMLSRVGITAKVETAPMGPYSGRASKQEFSFHMVGWGASTGEAVVAAALAARHLQPRQGPGRRQLGPLLQREGRLPDRAGAAAGERREPDGDAAAGDRTVDAGPGPHADPLPVHDVGDQEERAVRAAHGRVHAGVPVQAGQVVIGCTPAARVRVRDAAQRPLPAPSGRGLG